MATLTTTDGTTIAYDDYAGGPGVPVILVHGITESAASWEPLIRRFTPDRRVVVMDLRGHGRSGTADRYDIEAMAGDVHEIAAELDIERPHLTVECDTYNHVFAGINVGPVLAVQCAA